MIRFRGISKETKEYIYGDLLQINDHCYIYQNDAGDLQDIDFGYAFDEVDSKTVGQYTEVYDNDYCLVYSGDIMRKTVKELVSINPEKISEYVLTGEVVFNWGKFIVICKDVQQSFDLHEFCINAKVIGNIHENPELLRVDNEM